jgi:hypothetical protein
MQVEQDKENMNDVSKENAPDANNNTAEVESNLRNVSVSNHSLCHGGRDVENNEVNRTLDKTETN